MKRRSAGILLHLTSLPSDFGVGDLGPGARKFADFLERARQSVWQVLPFTPPKPGHGDSPYDCTSAFAGNPLLISPDDLHAAGWLTRSQVKDHKIKNTGVVAYRQAERAKRKLLGLAYRSFTEDADAQDRLALFTEEHAHWLEDYALFTALSRRYKGKAWWSWPKALRDRKPRALEKVRGELADDLARLSFEQFAFYEQWAALRRYCNQRGIAMFGDAPIYVAGDSAEVWARPELFKLNASRKPAHVAGVPPDAFSDTGQLWGNPVYNWDKHAEDGYDWWVRRLRHNLASFDMLRIDHFRGFVAYWQVSASARTAKHGKWVDGPGGELFREVYRRLPGAQLIAEDLGVITPDVRACMDRFDLPTMKVLLFAFGQGDGANEYLPHRHVPNSVVYTGTHDNNTARGWFEKEASSEEKRELAELLGHKPTPNKIAQDLTRMAMLSVSSLAVVPMQDVLGLDQSARMNTPSTTRGNWRWRMKAAHCRANTADRLARLTAIAGRA
jgi:4-alpha-glucanotransferase